MIEDRREERPVLLVDAGDFCPAGDRGADELTNKYFFEALKTLDYDAIAIGEAEILFGRRALLETAERERLPLVSANILNRATMKRIAAPHIVRTVGGRRFLFRTIGGVKVGIFGIAAPDLLYNSDRLVREYYEVSDPRIAALDAVSELRGMGCDIVIALSHQPWEQSTELAQEVSGIDIVISSHHSSLKTVSHRLGDALVVQTGDNKRSLTEIEIEWIDGRPEIAAVDRGDILTKLKDHPDFAKLEKAYQKEKNPITVDPRKAGDEIQREKTPIKRSPD